MRCRRLLAAALLAAAAGCGAAPSTLVDATPECDPGRRLAILAQAVPTAAYVPCIADDESPWRFSSLTVKKGRARPCLTVRLVKRQGLSSSAMQGT